MRKARVIVALAATIAPIACWAFIKPLRVLAPELAGLQCFDGQVCIDDPARLDEARALRQQALAFVSQRVAPIGHAPRMLFCTTAACEKTFGFTSNGAYNVGTSGLVVSRRGWAPHFVRHELIHHVQAEHLGALKMWLSTPTWLIEGMAYSWSEDPRRPLPPGLEAYRQTFETWAGPRPRDQVWVAAGSL